MKEFTVCTFIIHRRFSVMKAYTMIISLRSIYSTCIYLVVVFVAPTSITTSLNPRDRGEIAEKV